MCLGCVVLAVAAGVSLFPEAVGCGGHKSKQFLDPVVRCFLEVVFGCVYVLDRSPFLRYFSAEELVPTDFFLVVDQLLVWVGGLSRRKPISQIRALFCKVCGKTNSDDGE